MQPITIFRVGLLLSILGGVLAGGGAITKTNIEGAIEHKKLVQKNYHGSKTFYSAGFGGKVTLAPPKDMNSDYPYASYLPVVKPVMNSGIIALSVGSAIILFSFFWHFAQRKREQQSSAQRRESGLRGFE